MIKRQFPKTYEYVYELVTQGIHNDRDLQDRHIFMLTSYFLQDAAYGHMESYQIADMFDLDKEMAGKLYKFMFSLQIPKNDTLSAFKMDFANSFIRKNQFRLEDIFELALDDYWQEHPRLKPPSDMDDWRNLDNSMRAHDLR